MWELQWYMRDACRQGRAMELGDSARGEFYVLKVSEVNVYELGTVIMVFYFLAHPSFCDTIYAPSLLIHKSISQQSTIPGFVSSKR